MVNLAETRALLRGAAIAVMLGGLAGCTGNADAGPSPTTTVTAEPTGSASPETLPEKPQRPAAMDRDDAKGAAAAAEYFIELYPYVMATGDTEEFEGMSHEACGFCADALAQAESIQDNGDRWIGGDVTVAITETYSQDHLTGVVPLDVRIDQAAGEIIDSEGTVRFAQDRSVDAYRAELGLDGGTWQVVELALQGTEE